MNGKQITQFYAMCARNTDTGEFANWYHFATWGTNTINKLIESAGKSPMAQALERAEKRIYRDVCMPMVKKPEAVTHGFNCYKLAREKPDEAESLIFTGTLAIAQHEQRLIDGDLAEAFASVSCYSPQLLTQMLSVGFPTETLYLAQDVPGHPGTAATDWRDYHQRMRWITACIEARQGDPTLRGGESYHAILGEVQNVATR